jgi:hypothetical protein
MDNKNDRITVISQYEGYRLVFSGWDVKLDGCASVNCTKIKDYHIR